MAECEAVPAREPHTVLSAFIAAAFFLPWPHPSSLQSFPESDGRKWAYAILEVWCPFVFSNRITYFIGGI